MNITVERLPKCIATLSVEIPADAVNAEREKLVKNYTKQAKIPGFRPGKVPPAVIAKRYGKEIDEEIESELVNRGLNESLKQEKIKVLDFGTPSNIGVRADGSFAFQTTLTIAPDLVLPDYKNIPVSVPSEDVSDAEVQAQLNDIRGRFAKLLPVEGRAIAIGDMGVIDFHSTIDGVKLEEALGKPAGYLGGRENFWIRMEDDAFLPGFASQLVGAEINSEREIDIVIPDEFPLSGIVSKTLRFHVKLKEIKLPALPEVDDAFAAKLMGPEKTITDLLHSIREGIQANKKKSNNEAKVDQIITHLTNQTNFEIPETLLHAEAQRQVDEMVTDAAKEGMSDEEIMEKQDEFFQFARSTASNNIKANFILQEIAAAEEIHISDNELINHVFAIAERQNQEPVKFFNDMQRAGRLHGIRNSMLANKILVFLSEEALVTASTETKTAIETRPS